MRCLCLRMPVWLMALSLLLFVRTTTVAAPPSPDDWNPPQSLATVLEPRPALYESLDLGSFATSALGDQPLGILIELVDEPTVRTFVAGRSRSTAAQATQLAQAQLLRIETAQQSLLSSDPLGEAQLLYRIQRVFNGVAVRVPADQLPRIAALPGVYAIHPLPTYDVELTKTVPFVGAPDVWDALRLAGLDGSSISIGIIDTGIDYLHRTFGGPGGGYNENETTVISDTSFFPSARVVGGYDFAGDAYDANSAANATPQPDPDPMDCWGHGTHVAGIAAGSGVLANGSTYAGPFQSDLDFAQFSIGPGVAPRAQLYALKVFGCNGASQIVEQAIEWAVDPDQDGDFSDRLDVLNLSLGSRLGSSTDPSAVAIDNAALAGVVVVAAAGNTGDTFYITAAPGVATRSISVAASSTQGLPAPRQSNALVDGIASFSSRGPRRGDSMLKPDISAPGVNIVSAGARTGNGRQTSSGTSMAAPHVAGAAALLRQLHPSWNAEEIKALLINTAGYDLLVNEAYPPLRYGVARAGAGRLDLATAHRSDLIFYNADNSGAVSLSFGAPSIAGEMTMVQSARLVNKSSQSQRLLLRYFPVVDLPGVEIEIMGSSSLEIPAYGFDNVAVALHANADDMRNIADPTVPSRNYFPRHRLTEESGFIYAWPQINSAQTALAMTDPLKSEDAFGSAQFTFDAASGILSYTVAVTATQPATITAVDLRYGSAYSSGPVLHSLLPDAPANATSTVLDADVVLNPMQISLLAGGLLYIAVDIENEGQMRGQLQMNEPVLRLPIYVAPQPASFMRAGAPWLDYEEDVVAVRSLPLVGQGLGLTVTQSLFPTETMSLVSALELQFSSPNEPASTPPLDHADLHYVGVALNPGLMADGAKTVPVASRRIVFGLATYGEWSTLNEVSFRIHIDTDEDGFSEYILYTTNMGDFSESGMTDEFVTVLESVEEQTRTVTYFVNLISAAEANTAIFNNNVLLMAVDANLLGLSEENSDFRYLVSTYSRDPEEYEGLIDYTSMLHYDVARPGIISGAGTLGDLPVYHDLPGTELSIWVDRYAFYHNESQGLLLFHHHNVDGQRAETVDLRHNWALHLPILLGP